MNLKQREVLLRAYNSLNVMMDSDDFVGMGKSLIVRRRLAELLGLDLKKCLLPGEDENDEEIEGRFSEPLAETEDLSENDKKYLQSILKTAQEIHGFNDTDDACLRCARRMIAEVIGYEPLSHYFLLYEKEVKNIYYKPTDLKL